MGDDTSEPKVKRKLFVGLTKDVNEGIVSTIANHLGGEGRELGWTIEDGEHPDAQVELFLGTSADNLNSVSHRPDFRGGAVESIGFTSSQVGTGECLHRVLADDCRFQQATTNDYRDDDNYSEATTSPIGFTMNSPRVMALARCCQQRSDSRG